MKNTFEFSENDYKALAIQALKEIGNNQYTSTTLTGEIDGVAFTFVLNCIVYRKEDKISDIIPVWWEMHTSDEINGEFLNDFSWSKFKAAVLYVVNTSLEEVEDVVDENEQANQELYKLLGEMMEKHPDWRFGQLLVNCGFVEQEYDGICEARMILDPYSEESSETLNRVKDVIF